MELVDTRHILFLQWHGLTEYNNHFNRDKKRNVYVTDLNPPPPKPMPRSMSSPMQRVDIFYNEFRDGDNAVPMPVEMEYRLVEPLENHYRFVPLEYIKEHGVLEFVLDSRYPYAVWSLLQYSKAAEYQMIYIHNLIKEGRLTSKGKIVTSL
jgi:hypothetical protein